MSTLQSTLAIVAAGLAVLGVLPVLPALWRGLRAPGVAAVLGVGAAAAVLPALVALPVDKPFAPGFGLGLGFLIGGALTWLTLASELPPVRGGALALSAAALGPALALWRFHGDPSDVLMGLALGAPVVAAVGGGAARALRVPRARTAELCAVATVLVVAGVRLGMAHFPRVNPAATAGGYWAVPPLLVAGAALVLLIVGYRATRPWWPGIAGAAATVLFLLVLQLRLLPQLTWSAAAVGGAAFLLFLGLLAREERDDAQFRPLTLAIGLTLAALLTAAFAFRGLAGYGEVLALLPALALLAAVYPSGDDNLTPALGLGTLTVCALFVLTRLLFERFGHTRGLDFQNYYDVLTLLLGVGITLGMHAALSGAPPRLWPTTVRLAGVSLGAVGVPLALLALWGARALTAFLTGLGMGALLWMVLAAATTRDDRTRTLAGPPHALLLLAAIAAAQVAPRLFVKELATGKKVTVVVALTVFAALWVLVDTLARGRARKEALHAAE
jgi:hypothetical protein